MSAWDPSAPPAGYYPGQQGPPPPGFYPGQPGYPPGPGYPPQQGYSQPTYPQQGGGYLPQPGYPPQQGYSQPTYPQQDSGYPPQPGYPPQQGYSQPTYPQQGGGYPPQPGFAQPGGYSQPGGYPQPGYPGSAPPPYGQDSGVHPQPAMYGSSYADDPLTGGNVDNFAFDDKSIRRGFIKKVYSILMCQLLITLAFITLFSFHEPTKRYVRTHNEIRWVAYAVMIVTMLAMACCTNVRRKAPMNFVFLFLFTLAESFLLGVVAAAAIQSDAVMMAVGVTAAVCLGLTLFAFQTKLDFTVMGAGLFVAVIVLFVFGIVAIIFPGKTIILIYSSLGALLFSIYLVYDTQLMMGGKHRYSISPEEYIFAALNLYLDIVYIFIYILTIIGMSRDQGRRRKEIIEGAQK